MTETPPKIKKSEVVILFMNDSDTPKGVKLGSLEGKYSIPEDFNEPLDDLKEYM